MVRLISNMVMDLQFPVRFIRMVVSVACILSYSIFITADNDSVTIAGISVTGQHFAAVTNLSNSVAQTPFDG